MNHYATTAFHECMYLHYAERLADKSLPASIRTSFQKRQMEAAENYAASFQPLHKQFFTKLLNLMHPQQTLHVESSAILQMAHIIEKRMLNNEPCLIHSNDHRICLTDHDGTVIAWVKNHS